MAKHYANDVFDHKRLAELAWLNLTKQELMALDNPLLGCSEKDREYPGLHELRLMTNPEYLAYAAKVLLNYTLLPFQCAIMQELWTRPAPMLVATRGGGKTTLIAVMILLKMALTPGLKVVICGAGLRQSRLVFENMEGIWKKAPILRSIAGQDGGPKRDIDRFLFRINDSVCVAIPIGDGHTIRGLRANLIICDEFQSIPIHIYENVIQGFSSVSADPVGNVKEAARREYMKSFDMWTVEQEELFKSKAGNQVIIAGTADYGFRHFCQYWERYKMIVESRGDPAKLRAVFPEGVQEGFDWRDYSVMRIPFELIPKGFMEEKQVARARATISNNIYLMEYGATFIKDSEGFFKRSLIESCVVGGNKPIIINDNVVDFEATVVGQSGLKYVFGIDPASERDNFTICVLELHPTHTRVVYSWSTTKAIFRGLKQKGLAQETNDYFGFCARKIRTLMKKFPCERIGLDVLGGGYALLEALQDKDKIKEGESPILPVIVDGKPKDTDLMHGLKIVEPIIFRDNQWLIQANNWLKKDMEDKALLFPRFDTLSLALSSHDDKDAVKHGDKMREYDNLEHCVFEIEEMKDELATIIHSRSGHGLNATERWDTPEIKKEGDKKGTMKKDRYTALLIANALAHQINRTPFKVNFNTGGKLTRDANMKNANGKLYDGPDWFKFDGSLFRNKKGPRSV